MQDTIPPTVERAIESMGPKQVDSVLIDGSYISPGRGMASPGPSRRQDVEDILQELEDLEQIIERKRKKSSKRRRMKRKFEKQLDRMERKLAKQRGEMENELRKQRLETDRELERLRVEVKKLKREVKRIRNNSVRETYRDAAITGSPKTYLSTRNQRMDALRRGALGETQGLSGESEDIGSSSIHEVGFSGNAVKDAQLYISKARTDHETLIEIYGLTALEIMFLGKLLSISFCFFFPFCSSFPLADTHFHIVEKNRATAVDALNRWSTRKTFSQQFQVPGTRAAAFSRFINALRCDLTADPSLGDTELSESYWRLLELL